MRRFDWTQGVVRAASRVAAPIVAVLLVAPGCQLITGTFTAGSSLGPACTSLEACCPFLPSTEGTTCLAALTSGSESGCLAILTAVASTCAAGEMHDGGTSHDTGVIILPHMDASGQHDVTVGPVDTGHDAGSPGLSGTWTLTDITCEGATVTLTPGDTTSLSFTTGLVQEVIDLSDGCVETTDLEPATVTATTISASGGSNSCGSSCTVADGCTAGATSSTDLPYTLSGGTLQITVTVATTTCAAGTETFTFTQG